MLENILSFLWPPSFGSPVEYQDFEDNADPFSDLNGIDGIGLRMYDVRATGIEKTWFKENT